MQNRLMMKLPPLNTLRAFEAAARLSSFSKAGDELCVTHAAVSHQIKQLEEWFERPLFRRHGRGVKLTKTGEQLSAVVSEAFASISETSLSLKKSPQEETIVVGCLASIASRWLIPALPEFHTKHPQYSVQLFYVHTSEHLQDEGYDVLISLEEDPAANVHSVKLFSRRSLPVASPYYLQKNGAIDSGNAIAESDLLHDASRDDWRVWLRRAGLRDDHAAKGHIFEDFNMLATSVIAGHGVALCPIEVFRREIARGDLVVLSDICTRETQGYYLLASSTPTRTVKAFCEWFTNVCEERE